MLVLNNTPFVHARVYLQYLNSALPGQLSPPPKMVRCHVDNILHLYDEGAPYRHLVAML